MVVCVAAIRLVETITVLSKSLDNGVRYWGHCQIPSTTFKGEIKTEHTNRNQKACEQWLKGKTRNKSVLKLASKYADMTLFPATTCAVKLQSNLTLWSETMPGELLRSKCPCLILNLIINIIFVLNICYWFVLDLFYISYSSEYDWISVSQTSNLKRGGLRVSIFIDHLIGFLCYP